MVTTPETLGGFTIPAERDGRGWHDLAMERARIEGIPVPSEPCANSSARRSLPTWDDVAEVQAILDHYGITLDAIREHQAAEAEAVKAGTVVPISTARPGP